MISERGAGAQPPSDPSPTTVTLTGSPCQGYRRSMRWHWSFGVLLVAATVLGGAAYAGSDPTTAQGTPPVPGAPGQGELPLVLSIRALSLGQTPFAETGELERVKAPTGAGTSRWPSAATPIGRGVYISVMPACIPGVDEPLWPGTRHGGTTRRR